MTLHEKPFDGFEYRHHGAHNVVTKGPVFFCDSFQMLLRDTGEEPGMRYITTVVIPQVSLGFNSLAPGKIAGNWRFAEFEETIEAHLTS